MYPPLTPEGQSLIPRGNLSITVDSVRSLRAALSNYTFARIMIAPGHYLLNSELSVARSVSIEGAVHGAVVLDAQATSSDPRRVLCVCPPYITDDIQLIGLNLTGGLVGTEGGGGLIIINGQVDIDDCSIYSNAVMPGDGGGVSIRYVNEHGVVRIKNSEIRDNHASHGNGGGLSVSRATTYIENTKVLDNTAGAGGACYLGSADGHQHFFRCTITGNFAQSWLDQYQAQHGGIGGGIYALGGAIVSIIDSVVTENNRRQCNGDALEPQRSPPTFAV